VDDQPVFVAAEIEDNSVVTYEIDGTAELPLYFGRIGPMRLGRNREPRPNWVNRSPINFFVLTHAGTSRCLIGRSLPAAAHVREHSVR